MQSSLGIDKSDEAINVALKKLTSAQKTLIRIEEFEYLEQTNEIHTIPYKTLQHLLARQN